MQYHYAGDYGNFINEEGQILSFAMGTFTVIADNVNEFIESEAVKFYFLKNQKQWYERGFDYKQFQYWYERNELNLIVIEEASNKYNHWYNSKAEDIFLKCKYINGEIKGGNVYIKMIMQLKGYIIRKWQFLIFLIK